MEEQHIHKFERVKIGDKKYSVYKCMKPDCTHYVSPPELVVGRRTECWRCGNVVVVTKAMAKQKKPHCRGCTRPYHYKSLPPIQSRNPQEAA
jgi:hypothetical protein